MRFRLANPGNANYLGVEPLLNNMKLVAVNSGTELALATAIVDSNGNQITSFGSPAKPSASAVTQVASSITNVTLLASNSARLGATIFNDSTSAIFVKFGTTSTSTDFTIKLAAASYYEVPFSYTGRIDGIWVSANGNAYMTELTA